MAEKAFYVKLAVEGIQKYICSTGKLKEMIGGSEIINRIGEESFYKPILDDLALAETGKASDIAGHYIVAQANAGVIALIIPSQESARRFLEKASAWLLASYPGLPFYAAVAPFDLSDDAEGREAYSQARKMADKEIASQRNQRPVPRGSELLPILIPARLDGLPAMRITSEGGVQQRYSLPSLARSAPDLIEASRKRLQRQVEPPAGVKLVWQDDLEKLVGEEGGKVALICMDGNDLGKLFGARLKDSGNMTLSESIASMKELSDLVRRAGEEAFAKACAPLATWLLETGAEKAGSLEMPVRPLVMGGDDLTIIARAEIALAFVIAFAAAFEEKGREEGLSVGIGMVIMDSSYPFAKAFPLAESLQDSAKKLTAHLGKTERPSSIDYLVLTEDVENNIARVRQRLFTSASGEALTGKPFTVSQKPHAGFPSLETVIADGLEATGKLARSQLRDAWTLCRKGKAATRSHFENLGENVSRKLGGRGKELMSVAEFTRIFPRGYFRDSPADGKAVTFLGDYLELERLLPQDPEKRKPLLAAMKGKKNV